MLYRLCRLSPPFHIDVVDVKVTESRLTRIFSEDYPLEKIYQFGQMIDLGDEPVKPHLLQLLGLAVSEPVEEDGLTLKG